MDLTSLLNSQCLMGDGRGAGNETKDERAPDLNTPGIEPGTQCSTARPSAQRHE